VIGDIELYDTELGVKGLNGFQVISSFRITRRGYHVPVALGINPGDLESDTPVRSCD
jgi:hypothetical protein